MVCGWCCCSWCCVAAWQEEEVAVCLHPCLRVESGGVNGPRRPRVETLLVQHVKVTWRRCLAGFDWHFVAR